MPSEDTGDPVTTNDGPNLLEERSIGGILVHFLAIPTGVVGAGVVYLLATNEFTKRNARNALDWHLTVLALTTVTFGSLFTYAELTGQGATDVAALPSLVSLLSAVSTAVGVVVPALLTLWFAVTFWTFVVGLVAMGKATFGTAWRYPLSPALVERYGPRVDFSEGWPLVVLAYVVLAPLVTWSVFFGPADGAALFLSALGSIGLIVLLTPLTGVAMCLHGERRRPPDADWQPHVVAYIGIPVAIAVVGYALSGTFTDSINPAGDAVYVFRAAFWLSALVYVIRWRTASS